MKGGKALRLWGFINVFNQNPTFLQPVYYDKKLGSFFFQHSENKVTISSFEQADMGFYIGNAKFLVYPDENITVRIGSTVIFAVYMDGYIFWGDYLDIQDKLHFFTDSEEIHSHFPGFYNTCIQFLDEYKSKHIPDVKIDKVLENAIINKLFRPCSYYVSEPFNLGKSKFIPGFTSSNCLYSEDSRWIVQQHNIYGNRARRNYKFIDLYFQNKITPKLWTVDAIRDLIFSLARIRKSADYVLSLLNARWKVDFTEPLTPFREDLSYFPDLLDTDIITFSNELMLADGIDNWYIIDFLEVKSGYVLIAEKHPAMVKSFVGTHFYGRRNTELLLNKLVEELLKHIKGKLCLVINSAYIERIAKQSKLFADNSDKIRIIELPISNKISTQ